MRNAIVSFIMVVFMAGAVTAQEWERREDPIYDLRTAALKAEPGIGIIQVACLPGRGREISTKKVTILNTSFKKGANSIIVRWDKDEPEIQEWTGDEDNMVSISGPLHGRPSLHGRSARPLFGAPRLDALAEQPAVNEFITNLVQKYRLVIRAADRRGAVNPAVDLRDVTVVFDIGNADTKEAMDWVMEACK